MRKEKNKIKFNPPPKPNIFMQIFGEGIISSLLSCITGLMLFTLLIFGFFGQINLLKELFLSLHGLFRLVIGGILLYLLMFFCCESVYLLYGEYNDVIYNFFKKYLNFNKKRKE